MRYVVWRHFRRSYLKANVYPKLLKSVHAWRNDSLAKLARFFEAENKNNSNELEKKCYMYTEHTGPELSL